MFCGFGGEGIQCGGTTKTCEMSLNELRIIQPNGSAISTAPVIRNACSSTVRTIRAVEACDIPGLLFLVIDPPALRPQLSQREDEQDPEQHHRRRGARAEVEVDERQVVDVEHQR